MKRLNKKGMTTVEILVSFVIVAVISSTIYTTVSNYATRREIESYKLELNTYKNLLTKEIQDDLIKKGLLNVSKEEKRNGNADEFDIRFTLKNGEQKHLKITRQLTDDVLETSPTRNYDDNFKVEYNEVEYPIPDFGFSYNQNKKIVKDLRLTNVIVKTENNVFSLFLGFQHQRLSTKYGINIVCPINYQ